MKRNNRLQNVSSNNFKPRIGPIILRAWLNSQRRKNRYQKSKLSFMSN